MISYMSMSSSKASSIASEVLVAMEWNLKNMELAVDTFEGNARQENELIEKLDTLVNRINRVEMFYNHQLENKYVAVPDYILEWADEFLKSNSWGMR